MWTFNCARVYVGNYTTGHITFMPQDDTYREIHCGYDVVEGKITSKRLRSVKVKGAEDSLSSEAPYPKPFTILDTYVLYPVSDVAIIAVRTKEGRRLIKLVKHQLSARSTMYKMRL